MASSRPPAGSPEDVPNTRSTDGAARQGGTIARCSFVVTVKLFRLFPYELRIPIRLHPRPNPTAIRPASVEYPCWCSCSQSPASAGSSRAARQRHPHVASLSSARRRFLPRSTPGCFGCEVHASVARPRSAVLSRVATYRSCASRDNPRAPHKSAYCELLDQPECGERPLGVPGTPRYSGGLPLTPEFFQTPVHVYVHA